MFHNLHGVLKGALHALPRPLKVVKTAARNGTACRAPFSAQPKAFLPHGIASSVQTRNRSLPSASEDALQSLFEAQGRILR